MKIIFDERSTKFHTDDHNNVVEACNDLLDCKNFYELRGWLYLREVYFALGLNKESLYINPLLCPIVLSLVRILSKCLVDEQNP